MANSEDEVSSISGGSDLEAAVQKDTEYWETKPMVAGKSKYTKIHLVAEEDTDTSARVTTMCKARPLGSTALFAMAYEMRGQSNSFCNDCLDHWPRQIAKLIKQ